MPASLRRLHWAFLGANRAKVWRRTSCPREEKRYMDDQRAANLEEMDEQQAQRFLTELFSNLSA